MKKGLFYKDVLTEVYCLLVSLGKTDCPTNSIVVYIQIEQYIPLQKAIISSL